MINAERRIMSSRISIYCFLGLLAGLALLSPGCDSRTSTLQLNSNDVNALNQLYEKSGWSFRQSHVGLKAHADGAVIVEIEGEALQKGEDEAGSLLLPIVLTRELPPYYRIIEGSAPNTVELSAYQAKDGLWCVAAQVPLSPQRQPSPPESVPTSERPAPTPSPNELVGAPLQPTAVKLRVLIVSPEFSTTLPLLIPAGQSRAPVDTTVSLPNDARFSSLEVGSDKTQGQLTTLTVLPPTVSGNEVVAAAKLTPGTATAWDFSRLTFSRSANTQQSWNVFQRPLFLTSILIAVAMVGLFWIYEEQKLRRANQLSDLWNRWKTETAEIRREIEFQFKSEHWEARELLKKAQLLEDKFIKKSKDDPSIRRPAYELEEELETARKTLGELKEALESAYRTAVNQPEHKIEAYYANLKQLEHKADRLERTSEYVKRAIAVSSVRSRFLLYLVGLLAMSLLAVWFTTTVARGQSAASAKPTKAPTRFTVLGDLGLGVKPEAAESDKVAVTLNFFPLSSTPSKEGKEEVIFGLGDNNNLELEKITGTPEKLVEITQRSRKKATISMKVNTTKPSEFLNAVSNPYVSSVSPGKEFSDDLNNSNLIGLECLIRNGQTLADHNAGRWLHKFPFETVSLQIPIELSQPAYLSKIDIQRPGSDYEGEVTLEGLIGPYNQRGERSFVESGQDYQLNLGVQDSRVSIPANKHFVLKADFQRSTWQKLFLTAGQLVIALIIGGVLGIIATLIFFFAALGVASLPFVQRAAVFAKYTSLPAVATGEGVTVFELFFFASFLFYAGAAFGAFKLVRRFWP